MENNSQYDNLKIRTLNTFHDRFLVMDDHIGSSLKDLGKKVFVFSTMDMPSFQATTLHKKEA